MKISEDQRFLALDYDADANVHRLAFLGSASDALKRWGANTRISPIWKLIAECEPPKKSRKRVGIAFLGPVNPVLIETEFGTTIFRQFKTGEFWCSLGFFNLIVSLSDNDEFEAARAFAEKYNCSIELWQLDKAGQVDLIESARRRLPKVANAVELGLSSKKFANDALADHLLEFDTLLATAIGRGVYAFPWIADDLRRLETAVKDILFDQETGEVISAEKLSRVLYDVANVNAGLSRFVSQSLSGTTPIMMTECHFWPHSLLGTTVANASLRMIVDYVSNAIGRARIPDRIKQLSSLHYSGPPLFNNKPASFRDDVISKVENLPPPKPLINPITYYSGRDGFKNDSLTASAPLASIASANCVMWNPTTITHELSHRIVSPVLANLIPLGVDKLARDYDFLAYGIQRPTNYFDAARQYLIQIILALAFFDKVPVSVERERGPEALFNIIRHYEHALEEMMVHAFDFLYFFRRRPADYVKSIWISWGAIPNISDRTEEYLLRTLVALMSDQLHMQDPASEVRRQIQDVLKLPEVSSQTSYAAEALSLLTDPVVWKNRTCPMLIMRAPIAQFVRFFLYSERLAVETLRDQFAHGPAGKYDFSPLELSNSRFENPLLFLQQYANDPTPNRAMSVWVHHMLSFNMASSTG